MPRRARPKAQQRFDLYIDDPDEMRLIVTLGELAKSGKQREWIVDALLAQLNQSEEEHDDELDVVPNDQ